MSTLYQALLDAGIEISNHESDLYFPLTPASHAILAQFPLQRKNAATFINQAPPHRSERWIDVPFAFVPFWDAVQQRVERRQGKL